MLQSLRLAGLLLLSLILAVPALAQDCTRYLNTTDGKDPASPYPDNVGTIPKEAIRSFELAFRLFPDGSVVCMTAGEYFRGMDEDGIQLTGEEVHNKSMTFVLNHIGEDTEIAFTEDSMLIDIGDGVIRFVSGTASKLRVGAGRVNNPTNYPALTNHLHTIELRSGVLDVSGVSLTFDEAVGNPSFSPSAAIIRGAGSILGSPDFTGTGIARVVRYTSAVTVGPEFPPLLRRLAFAHPSGLIQVDRTLPFIAGGTIRLTGAGDATIGSPINITEAGPNSIQVTGSGDLAFTSDVTLNLTANVDGLIAVNPAGSLTLQKLVVNPSANETASLVNRGALNLGSVPLGTSTPLTLDNQAGEAVLGLPATTSQFGLHVSNAAGAIVRIAGTPTLHGDVENNGTILLDGPLRIAQNDASVVNRNTVAGEGALIFTGSGQSLEATGTGTGAIRHLTIELPAESNQLTVRGGTQRQTGTLTISRGGLLVESGSTYELSGSSPTIRRNLADANSDGMPDGRPVAANEPGLGTFTTNGSAFNLEYFGGMSTRTAIDPSLASASIRDLRISVEPLGGGSAILELPADLTIQGALRVDAGAVLDLLDNDLTAEGAGATHTIAGIIEASSGALTLAAPGTVQGNPGGGPSTIRNLTVRSSGPVAINGILSIPGELRVESGTAQIGATAGGPTAIATLRQTGESELQLQADVQVTSLVGLSAGRLRLGEFDLLLGDGSSLTAGASAAMDGDGHVVFTGNGTLNAGPLPIPHLAIHATGKDTVRLAGPLTIGDSFALRDGVLNLGNHTLTHLGRTWQFEAGSIVGSGAVRLRGDVQADFAAPARVPYLILDGVANEPVLSLGNHPIEVDSLVLRSGIAQLGNQDLVVHARLRYEGGGLTAAESDTFDSDPLGEIVLSGAEVRCGTGFTVPNVRVRADSRMHAGCGLMRISRQITFESGKLLDVTTSNVRMESGSRIVRQGLGTFDGAPFFESGLVLRYDLDETEIGSVTAGPELPATVHILIVEAGENSVELTRPATIDSSLVLTSGTLMLLSELTIEEGGKVHIARDGATTPAIAGDPYQTAGPITLEFSGTTGDLSSTDFTFPEDASIGMLRVRMGNRTTVTNRTFTLHADRQVGGALIRHVTSGSAADLNGKSLVVDGNLEVVNGILRSSSESTVEVHNRLIIASGGTATDRITVTVLGRTDIDGRFTAERLRANGDVVVRGRLGGRSAELDAAAGNYIAGRPSLEILRPLALRFENGDSVGTNLDDSVNELVLRSDTADGSIFYVSRGDTAHTLGVNRLVLESGVLVTARNTIRLPANGPGVQRKDGRPSYIVGRVSRLLTAGTPIESGASGRFVFPVGSPQPNARYRPLTLEFRAENPLQATTLVTVTHENTAPGGYSGLPLTDGLETTIGDAAGFYWTVQSTSELSASQLGTISVVGTGFDSYETVRDLRILRRGIGRPLRNPWRAQGVALDYDNAKVSINGTSAPLVQAVNTGIEIGPKPTIFALGIQQDQIDFARLQLINVSDTGVDVLVDGVKRGDARPGSGTPYIRVASGRRGLSLRTDSIVATSDSVDFAPGVDYVALAYQTLDGRRSVAIVDSARATPDPQESDLASVAFLNGMVSSPPLTLSTGGDVFPVLQNVPFGMLSQEYAPFSTGEIRMGVSLGNQGGELFSYPVDLEDARGLTVLAVATGVLDGLIATPESDLLVITSNGDVLAGGISVGRDVEEEQGIPERFTLHGNYPNPFNPSTTIIFDLPQSAEVTVELFDMLGRRVAEIGPRSIPAGKQQALEVNAGTLASGVYLYRVLAETSGSTQIESGTMTLVK